MDDKKLNAKSKIDCYVDEMTAWTLKGDTTYDIADKLGCSSTLVQRVLKREGVKLNGKKPGYKIDRPSMLDGHIDSIRSMTEEGHRIGHIAKHFGCSKQAVHNMMVKHGIPRHPKHSCPGDKNPAWKGGKHYDNDGYVMIYCPNHPYATYHNNVREHRLVMEEKIGRYLLPGEVVDHIDGNKSNNHPDNLRLFASNTEHLKETLVGKVPNWTEEGRNRIRIANLERINRLLSSSR